MPQRFPILAVALLLIITLLPAVARAQRSLDLAESRYQQASRETYIAQKAFDDAVARTREVGKAYQAALDEQRAASRLLADANVTGPKAAEKVRQAERGLEAERERVAPQYAPVEAAAAAHRAALDRALAQSPEWVAARGRVSKAQAAYEAAVDERLAALADSDDAYLELLAESWDAEDAAIALRDTPNVETQKLVDATNGWMAAIEALDRYEAEAVGADPAVRAADDALAREEENGDAVRAQLAKGVANDPDVASTAVALSAAENAFWASGTNLRQLQADLDVQRTELTRIDRIAASAHERLAKVEPNLRAMADELAKLDEAARRAQDQLAAAQTVEERALAEREQLAADIARETYVPPPQETVYVETPVYIDSGTTIYYPPVHRDKHYDHGRDKNDGRDRDRDYGRVGDRGDSDRNRDSDRNDDRGGGTRRDDGAGPARGRDYERTPRGVGDPAGDSPRTPVKQPDNKQPAPRPNGDDDATARRKQEEAKAAERQRREDAAAGAAQQQKKANDDAAAQAATRQREESSRAAARQREESSRAAAQRQEESSRRQQQQSEAAARQRQQDQERNQRESSSSGSSNSGSSSSSGDRGDRYRRK